MTTAITGQTAAKPTIKVADEVWVATLMLHQRHPERSDSRSKRLWSSQGQPRNLVHRATAAGFLCPRGAALRCQSSPKSWTLPDAL